MRYNTKNCKAMFICEINKSGGAYNKSGGAYNKMTNTPLPNTLHQVQAKTQGQIVRTTTCHGYILLRTDRSGYLQKCRG